MQGLRKEDIPALNLWDTIIDLLRPQPGGDFKPVHQSHFLKHHEPFEDIEQCTAKRAIFSKRTSLHIFGDHETAIKQIQKGRSPTTRHVSRADRVDLGRLYDRINLGPMVQIKYVNSTQQLADILTKASFTGDRWTQLTLLANVMTHTTFILCNLSVSSAVVNPLLSGMRKLTTESFTVRQAWNKKPVHCAAMIARRINDKIADMDYHAVPPPDHRAGWARRLWSARSSNQTFTRTATGGSSSSGRPDQWDPWITGERKVHLQANSDGENCIRKVTRAPSCRSGGQENAEIFWWFDNSRPQGPWCRARI